MWRSIVILHDSRRSQPLQEKNGKVAQDFVPVPCPGQVSLDMVQGGPVVSGEACPHHDGASARGSQQMDAVLRVSLTFAPPDLKSLVWMDQTEPGFVIEHGVGPLATGPARMLSGPPR